MKYTVSVNEKERTVTVILADGTKGVAKCCPTDRFDINTGIELALERAKVAKTAKSAPKPMSVMEMVKAIEATLKGNQIIVIGCGNKPNEAQKRTLANLAGVATPHCKCKCKCDSESYDEGYDKGYDKGHDAGYDKGYAEGYDEGYNEGGMTEEEAEKVIDNVLVELRASLEELIH